MNPVATLKQQLFRWQSDGAGSFRLGQRRVFIIPSRSGVFFAVALLVMLVGAINYTLALGYALVFLLTGIGITGMVHTFRNLYQLTITPGRSESVFAGEIAYFPLTLGNDRGQPRLALELEAESGLRVNAAVDGFSSTKINIPVSASRRGWLTLPRTRLSTVYPLGLFYAWSYLQPSMRCLIYPKPIYTPLPPCQSTPIIGMESGNGGQEDFAGFRERQPSDSPRHVAWKASARDPSDRPLLVKQFAGGAQLELSLDWALTDPALPMETRISIMTGWLRTAALSNNEYALRLPGIDIPAASGERHLQRCLEALALFDS